MNDVTEGIARTRARPGSATALVRAARVAAGWLLVLAGIATAAGAVRAHRFDASLPDVVDGAPPALGPEIGDDRPFEPFTVALIDAPRGDHAALDRALAHAQDAGAGVMVVLGDVLPISSRGLAPLADVLLRHPGSLLLAGRSRRLPADVDERLTGLLLPPEAWDIRTRGCTLRGERGSVRVTARDTDGDWTIATPDRAPAAAGIQLLHVRGTDHAEHVSSVVRGGVSASALARGLCLGALWPIASSTTGLVGTLCAAFVSALLGLRLARMESSQAREGT